MNYRINRFFKRLCTVLFCLTLAHRSYTGAPLSQPTAPSMQAPQLSEEELKQLEKDLEAFQNHLQNLSEEEVIKLADELMESLSPEEREAVQRETEELMKQLMLSDQAVQPQPPKPAEPPKPIEKKEEKKPIEEEKKPTIPKKQIDKTVKMLNAIFDHIDDFLHKTEIVLDFPHKVEKWGKAGFIRNWDPLLTWQQIKMDFVRLAYKMRSLGSRNPKTNEYYFIDDILKDKALYNNLEHLEKQLAQNESQIELNLTLMKLKSSSSKDAVRNTIGFLLEALKFKKIPEATDAIIAKYGQIAEKIKKEEEEAVKKAIEELKKPRRAEAVKVIGALGEDAYALPIYPDVDYGYGVPGYYPPYASPRRPEEKRAAKPEEKKPTDKKEEKSKAPTPSSVPETHAEKRINELLETLEFNLDKAEEEINKIVTQKDIPSKLKADANVPPDNELIDTFKEIRNSIEKAINAIGAFNIQFKQLVADNVKKKYTAEIHKTLEKPIKTTDKLKEFLESITPHESKETAYKTRNLLTRITKFEEKSSEIGTKK